MGKSLEEVQSWPAPVLAGWRAYFKLQEEDREAPPEVDESELEEKLARTLKPRPRE